MRRRLYLFLDCLALAVIAPFSPRLVEDAIMVLADDTHRLRFGAWLPSRHIEALQLRFQRAAGERKGGADRA